MISPLLFNELISRIEGENRPIVRLMPDAMDALSSTVGQVISGNWLI